MRSTLLAALAVAASVLAACHFPDPKVEVRGTYPIDLAYREGRGGLVILRGRVNGREDVDFILDTGAPVSVLLDGKRTTKLGFDTRDAKPLGDPSNPATPVGVVLAGNRFDFGPVALDGLTAVIVPESSMPCRERFDEVGFGGVVGADLFRKFVVEIDPAAKRVRLHDPKSWQPAAGASVVPIAFRDGHPHVDVKVKLASGAVVTDDMNLDIGMNRALTLVAGSHPEIVMPTGGTVRKSCFVNGAREERDGEAVDVTLGTKTLRVEAPRYSDFPNAVGGRRNGSLGVTFFQGQRLTIDYPGRRIILG